MNALANSLASTAAVTITPIDGPLYWRVSNSWNMRQHYQVDGRDTKLRIRIHWDGYEHQSFAMIEALDPVTLVWRELGRLAPHQMTAKVSSGHLTLLPAHVNSFGDDAYALLELAEKLL